MRLGRGRKEGAEGRGGGRRRLVAWSLVCVGLGIGMCGRFLMAAASTGAAGVSVPILMYHHIQDGAVSPYAVGVADFDAQMAYVHDCGYTAITLAQFLASRTSGARLPANPIIITLDDGYLSALTKAKPLLDKYGLTATLFVITDRTADVRSSRQGRREAGEEAPSEPNLIWPEVVTLAEAGYDIGSHTCTHPDLKAASAAEVAHELAASKAALESHLGRTVGFLAYPFGYEDPRVQKAAAAAGYVGAVVASGGIENTAKANVYGLRRVPVVGGQSLADFAASLGRPPRMAGFIASPTSGPAPLTVRFTDTSTGTPTAWAWDYGDGASGSGRNPTHVYTAAGTYTVKLTTSDAWGASAQMRAKYITVR